VVAAIAASGGSRRTPCGSPGREPLVLDAAVEAGPVTSRAPTDL